jgi:glycosyltransferase 2 family protein
MTQSKKTLKSILMKVVAVVLPMVALAYVIAKIWVVRSQILERINIWQAAGMVLGGCLIYALADLLLVLAWRRLLYWFGETKTPWKMALKIYGTTQIAKYLPGNILQFPSRHVAGRQRGLGHTPLVGAALFEIIELLTVAGVISSLFFLQRQNQTVAPVVFLLICVAGILSPLVVQIAASYMPFGKKIGIPQHGIRETYSHIIPVWSFYTAFFLISGGIVWLFVYVFSGPIPISIVISAYSFSWLAGIITPGAPGGAGVREAIMILTLSSYVGEPLSVLIALVSRLVTILGDVVFYFLAQLSS